VPLTGQTGDGHRSDRWPPLVEPVSPYRFFQPSLGRTDDFDKFNREALSVELTYPQKFWFFASFLRFCSLNLLQIFYRTFCIHLGCKKIIMWLQGRHRSNWWCAPVRPLMRTGQTGAPLRKRFWATQGDFHPNLYRYFGYETWRWYWSKNHQFLEEWRIIQFIRKFLILPRERDK
jgi:hypothetical protein